MTFNAYGTSPNDQTLAPLLGSFDTLEEAIDEIVVRKSGGQEVHVLGASGNHYDQYPIGKMQLERGKPGRWLKAAVHLGTGNSKRTSCVTVGNVIEESY